MRRERCPPREFRDRCRPTDLSRHWLRPCCGSCLYNPCRRHPYRSVRALAGIVKNIGREVRLIVVEPKIQNGYDNVAYSPGGRFQAPGALILVSPCRLPKLGSLGVAVTSALALSLRM